MKDKKNLWELPDLKKAQRRTNQPVNIERESFTIPLEVAHLGVSRHYYLRTYGCQANERDGETIAGILEEMGFVQTDDVDKADLILLNTCAIRKNAEDRVFGEIGNLKHLKIKNPDLILGVCGCMPQEEDVVKTILQTYHHVDLIFGTHNIHRLPQLLHQVILSKERTVEVYSEEGNIMENLPVSRFGKHKAWVNIMYGCDKFCTYCIVPYTRGKERSRLMSDILEEIVELKKQGYKEVTLLGQNVNAYGKDLDQSLSLAGLLQAVAQTNIDRIRFTTSHPWDFTDELIDTIATHDNIMPYIHLPIQSGSNAMLKIMGRRYTIEEYKDTYQRIKAKIPHCSFSSDIIVGFPNESDEQFQETLDIVDYCQFDNVYTFIYSQREGTPAASMDDNVSTEIKKRRLAILNEKVKLSAYHRNVPYLNSVVTVLVDGPSKKDATVNCGYTETQKLVHFKAQNITSGSLVKVRITEVKTWFLLGEIMER